MIAPVRFDASCRQGSHSVDALIANAMMNALLVLSATRKGNAMRRCATPKTVLRPGDAKMIDASAVRIVMNKIVPRPTNAATTCVSRTKPRRCVKFMATARGLTNALSSTDEELASAAAIRVIRLNFAQGLENPIAFVPC